MPVAFEAVADTTVSANAATTLSWTHPGVAPSAVAVTLMNYNGARTVTGVTYGGVAMTQASVEVGDLSSSGVQIWGLANPPSGSQTVVVTFSGTGAYCSAGSISVTGSDTTTCFVVIGTPTTGNSTAPSASITAPSGSLIIDVVGNNNGKVFTIASGQTQEWTNSAAGNEVASSTIAATGSSQSVSWTVDTASNWSQCIAAFGPSGGAGSSFVPYTPWPQMGPMVAQ